ncbi:MAG: DNA cytosine methyltransferase [Clostridia bacterium]|nr:DNA cytosine methyltransferase [Clostridia bacterium]
METKPKVIDLFAGVGGLSLGFENAGFNVVFANEYDSDIANAYKVNHRTTEMLIGDITKISIKDTFEKYKDNIDVIIGGPPCQGFSQKGKRLSINDERNFLFKYYYEIVKFVRPKYFVIENVPNILTTCNGYFKKQIIELFNEQGYTLNMDVLNAENYGVPQSRRRAVIIGKLGKNSVALPEPNERRVSIWEAISDLAYLNSGEGREEQEYVKNIESNYQKIMRNNQKKLYNHVATKHSADALKKLELIPPECGKECLPKELLTKSIYSGTWTRMNKDDVSVTITTRFDTPSSGKFTHPFLNRAITVREAARLQSFPDNFIFCGSKTSQMKQVGNAVPPKLAQAVAESIMKDIEGDKKKK